MNAHVLAGGATIAAAVAVALAGCGSDPTTAASSSSPPTASSTTPGAPSSAAEPEAPARSSETIADYIAQNDIVQTPVRRGDPGAPKVDIPVPEGWQDAGAATPQYAFSALRFVGDPAAAADPPTIIALMSKLTGNVDVAKVLEFAPGELKNLPGFEGSNGKTTTLGRFEAFQIGGTYVRQGVQRLVAQKTVVIPSGRDLYVLQLNANGVESQMGALMSATSEIDAKTVITP